MNITIMIRRPVARLLLAIAQRTGDPYSLALALWWLAHCWPESWPAFLARATAAEPL